MKKLLINRVLVERRGGLLEKGGGIPNCFISFKKNMFSSLLEYFFRLVNIHTCCNQ